MEDRAPYHLPEAPKGPRNLAPHVAAWLRRLGFTATEHLLPNYASVAAHWTGPRGEHFLFDYTWVTGPVPEANCRLRVLYADRPGPEPLFTAQRVHRVKDVRQLLTGCVRLHNARLLAKAPVPTA
jgi:hypothetical protein